jgi:hypothetical protein
MQNASLWQQDLAVMKKQKVQLDENGKCVYPLIIGQCSLDLESNLKGFGLFEKADNKQDIIQLLLIIQGFCCRFKDNQQPTWALEQAKHHVSTYYQVHGVANTEYVEHF